MASHLQRRGRGVVVAAAVALAVAAAVAASRIQHVSADAVSLSMTFIDLLRAGELDKAYELTVMSDDVGRDLKGFADKVRREGVEGGARTGAAEMREVRPFQSYGNRLRRWINGESVDQTEANVDFSVGGVPFKVGLVRFKDGRWRVRNFQSHAA